MSSEPFGSPPTVARGPRLLAGISCALQSLALLGFTAFYLYELSQGEGSDTGRVVMSAVVIAIGGVGLALLSRGWFGESSWPRTPTIVWHLLLVPVGVSLAQAGQSPLAWMVLLLAVLTFAAAVAARRDPREDAGADG